jgi:Flavin-binding monooxygenase-like
VGANESAIDLSIHSLPYATKVYVSQRRPHPRHPTVFNRDGVTVVSTINHLTENEVHLDDGTILNVDTIVFATGYFYTYPFLNKVRPPTDGKRVPGLYQHIFDMYNPNIAFIGVANATLSWLAWEKAAFLVALLWAGKIHLPDIEEQKKWENSRLHLGRHFHILKTPAERVIYFEDLNELAAEYLATDALDDELLRSYPYEWMLALVEGHRVKANFYGIKEPTSNHSEGTETEKADVAKA